MAVYAQSSVEYIEAGTKSDLAAAIAAHILTLDKTTYPVIGIFQYGAGVLVVGAA